MATKTVPAAALRMGASVVEFRSNGPNAKTTPVRLVARSAEAIDHWYWGKIVHDLGGVRHKSNIPIDYAHNPDDVLGFLNHFEATERGLEVSGALVPYSKRADDKASEVIHKQAAGVPYEASINWEGPAKLQALAENEVATVNGRELVGPATIVRDWTLRGVAVCPYGADHNTATEFRNASATAEVEFLDVPAEARRFVTPATSPSTSASTTPEPSRSLSAVAPSAVAEAEPLEADVADGDQAEALDDQAEAFAPAEPLEPDVADGDQSAPADAPTTLPAEAAPVDPPATPAEALDDQAAPVEASTTTPAEAPPADLPAPAATPATPGDQAAPPATTTDDDDDDPAPIPADPPPVAAAATASAGPVEADRAAAGRSFVEAFGPNLGPRYFAEGLTLAAAKDRAIADLAEENRRLVARLSAIVGGSDLAPLFSPDHQLRGSDGATGRDPLADRVGPGVARFARAVRNANAPR